MSNFTNPNMNGDLAQAYNEIKNEVENAVEFPVVNSNDNDKVMKVVDGKWSKADKSELIRCNIDTTTGAITLFEGYTLSDFNVFPYNNNDYYNRAPVVIGIENNGADSTVRIFTLSKRTNSGMSSTALYYTCPQDGSEIYFTANRGGLNAVWRSNQT